MRHRKAGRQLGRNSGHRRALFRNLVTSFFEHERIETTEAKAKEIRSIAEKLVTLAKKGDLAARRSALSYLKSKTSVVNLFDKVSPRFSKRNGGYTRIIKTRRRYGDGARMAVIELVDREVTKPKEEKKEKK